MTAMQRAIGLILFAIIVIAAIIYIPSHTSISKRPQTATSTLSERVQFVDQTQGFSIMYPKNTVIVKTGFEGYLPHSTEPAEGFLLASSSFSGTNLSETGVFIGTSKDAHALATCLQADPLSGETIGAQIEINSVPFLTFTSSGAGAGNFYESTSYRTVSNGICYEVVALIHSLNIGNFPEGSVRTFDRTAVEDSLETIVATFKLL